MTTDQIAAKAWEKIVSYFGINTSPHEDEGVALIKAAIERATELLVEENNILIDMNKKLLSSAAQASEKEKP
jgi:hypothetical protein